ncbi:unnamed protein product [Bemisia tabaci]|uniref:Ig-like domain-containing protein n=1 Tax=Bemisia tabaci TaxID=7038 RepID=A0A9P0AHH5_BEMTA|nr:unnamed protein product [Bemisia tabaci]
MEVNGLTISVLIYLCFSFFVESSPQTKTRIPECESLGDTVDCSDHRLTSVPTDLPKWTKILKLNKNLLTSIPPMNISGSLISLIVSKNKIQNVGLLSLDKFPALKTLILNDNNITAINEADFDGLTSLKSLKINKNRLEILNKTSFRQLKELNVLELMRNRISSISGIKFQGLDNLKVLKLSQNKIKSLPDGAFFGLKNLEILNLDRNALSVISKSWLFGLDSLQSLSISHNRIYKIDDGWEGTQTLINLNLSFNEITAIENDTFKDLGKLNQLNLNNNHITLIAEAAFNHTPVLETLELNNNFISWTIEDSISFFSSLKRLIKLSLVHNLVTSINKNAFIGLESLVELDLGNNKLISIDENAFSSSPNLKRLHINSTSLLCDCALAWFPQYVIRRNLEKKNISAVCSHPQLTFSKSILDLSPEQFVCAANDVPRPQIVEDPEEQKALAGNEVTLKCAASSSSDSPMVFLWKRNNVVLDKDTKNRQVHEKNNSIIHYSQLKLLNVSTSHSGYYQCIVTNGFGNAYSKRARLEIYVFPVFSKSPNNITVRTGSTARLDCAAAGLPAPQIGWNKDGGSTFPALSERRMNVMPSDDAFFIVNVKAVDAGVYSCTAQNAAGIAAVNASIYVSEPPSFVEKMKDKEAKPGEAVVLECMATGLPKPNLVWSKNGERITNQSNTRYFLTADDQLLIIRDTEQNDAGIFECEVSNSLGSERGRSQLYIIPISGESFVSKHVIGILMISAVLVAVITSAIWVCLISYIRAKGQQSSSVAPTQADSKSDHSSQSSKDSGTGESPRRSREDLICNGTTGPQFSDEQNNSVSVPEVNLPLLSSFLSYNGENVQTCLKETLPMCHRKLPHRRSTYFDIPVPPDKYFTVRSQMPCHSNSNLESNSEKCTCAPTDFKKSVSFVPPDCKKYCVLLTSQSEPGETGSEAPKSPSPSQISNSTYHQVRPSSSLSQASSPPSQRHSYVSPY